MVTKQTKKRVKPPVPRYGPYDPIPGKRLRLKKAPDFRKPRRKSRPGLGENRRPGPPCRNQGGLSSPGDSPPLPPPLKITAFQASEPLL